MLYPELNDLLALKNQNSRVSRGSRRSVVSMASGNHQSPFRGQGLEFDSVREYVPGSDDIRSIDWKVTARMGSAHVKLFRQERERHTIICIDRNTSMQFGTKNTFKSVQAARVAALLGWSSLADQDRVSALLFGDVAGGIQFFPPKRTRSSFYMMLKTLCQPNAEIHLTSTNAALEHLAKKAHTGSLVYFISDFMDLEVDEGAVHTLNKRCDVIFISINDPADKSLEALGKINFSGTDGEKFCIDTESAAGRKAYEEMWKENRRELYALTSKCKIPLIELTTQSDIQKELFLAWKKTGKK
jgi:uncharacterized protein (DUF58 family)